MRSKLILRKAIWNQDQRRSIINQALTRSAEGLEAKLKSNIDESTPAGRYYRIGVISERRRASNKNLRKKAGTKTRVIVGVRLHRASAQGQPPARRFNKLYNAIKVKRVVGKWAIVAEVNAPGVVILDDVSRLNRPFFKSVISNYRNEEFVDTMRSGVRELIT